MIALGEQLFGMTPFGWRFVVARARHPGGPDDRRIGRRLFRSTLLGCIAGLLLAVDGLAFVHSRTALLDPLLMFWALAAFGAWSSTGTGPGSGWPTRLDDARRLGGSARGLGLRPWRLLAGVCLGAGVRDEVERALLRRGLRRDDACSGTWAPGVRPACAGRGSAPWSATPRRPSPRWCWSRSSSTSRRGPAGSSARRRATCGTGRSDNPGPAAGAGRAAQPLALPPRGVEVPHRPRVAPTPTGRTRGAGWCWPGRCRTTTRARPWGSTAARSTQCSRRSPPWARRRSGGPPAWRCRCCSTCGPRAATGGPARSSPASSPATCRGSSSRSARSTPSTPWPSCRSSCSRSPCASAWCSAARTRPPRRRQWGAAAAGAYLLLAVANFAWLLPVLSAEVIPYADWARPDVVESPGSGPGRPPRSALVASESKRTVLVALAANLAIAVAKRPPGWSAGRARCWPRPPTRSPTPSTRSSCSPA